MPTEQDVTCFRIYTQDVAPTDKRLSALGITPDVFVALEFGEGGYTTYREEGCWDDTPEPSIVFEILGSGQLQSRVLKVANEIQDQCGQDAVIVTVHRVHQFTLTGV